MQIVLLGGAPGIGKSAAARQVLNIVAQRATARVRVPTVQKIDVDELWLHQPWRVDSQTTAMVRANLRAVLQHATDAGIDVALVVWVFQDETMHDLVRSLAPANSHFVTVQLTASKDVWRDRFRNDSSRPDIGKFYRDRYAAAQHTPVDHVVPTDGRTPVDVAHSVATAIGLLGTR